MLASHSGATYRTEITTTGTGARKVWIGHTLPRGTRPSAVLLDGQPADPRVRTTNRGTEVTTATDGGHHTLIVTA